MPNPPGMDKGSWDGVTGSLKVMNIEQLLKIADIARAEATGKASRYLHNIGVVNAKVLSVKFEEATGQAPAKVTITYVPHQRQSEHFLHPDALRFELISHGEMP